MVGQTFAIFIDAYRELNAKRLFWVTLIISGAFVGAFAFVGVGPGGLTVLKWDFNVPLASFVYRTLFSFVIVGIWASWAAVIIALVSTAGAFPDLMSGGAIDLYLSKPIGRLRLFLTKYATGLLFVLLQTAVFATAAYFVMGLRGKEWRPGVFLMIPLVTCMFSYLFAICVLFGVVTRSAIAALLLTVLVWAFFWVVAFAENRMLEAKLATENIAKYQERRLAALDAEIKGSESKSVLDTNFGLATGKLRLERQGLVGRAESSRQMAGTLGTVHTILFNIATVIPKTSQTVNVLDRHLFTDEEVNEDVTDRRNARMPPGVRPKRDEDPAERAAESKAILEGAADGKIALRDRPLSWVIGTSLAFEAVVLAMAACVFCRRDY